MHAPSSILIRQKELITTFQAMREDPDIALDHLISLGKGLSPFPEAARQEDNLVPGCLARVWLTSTYKEGALFFHGDSEAAITKGLLAALLYVFSGQKPHDIVAADLSFIKEMGLPQLLGVQRRTGLGAMISQIRKYAQEQEKNKV